MKLKNLLVLLSASFILIGCEMFTKVVEVVKDPDVQVGDDADQPTAITVNAIASNDVNGGAPIVVSIYALSSDHRFYGYDLYSLIGDPKDVLGPTLVDVMDEVSMEPGEYETFGAFKMPENTRYLAVIAQFGDFDGVKWRDAIEVDDVGEPKNVILSVTHNSVSIRLEGK